MMGVLCMHKKAALALILAITYSREITPKQCILYLTRKDYELPQPQKISDEIIQKCKKYIERNKNKDYIDLVYIFAARRKINFEELLSALQKSPG